MFLKYPAVSAAKKMMSLVSGRLDADSAAASSSSLSLKTKRGKKKLYRPEISCPMEMPPHPVRVTASGSFSGAQAKRVPLFLYLAQLVGKLNISQHCKKLYTWL